MLDLPVDKLRSSASGPFICQSSILSNELYDRVRLFLGLGEIKSSTLFLGVLQLYLSRFSIEERIPIGLRHTQSTGKLDNHVSHFSMECMEFETFSKLLEHTQIALDNIYHHQSSANSISSVVESDALDLSNSSEFQVMFSLKLSTEETSDISDIVGSEHRNIYELYFEIVESDLRFTLSIWYDSCLFNMSTIGRICEQYINLLGEILESPDLHPDNYSILPSSELSFLVRDLNMTKSDYPEILCFHELFEAQASVIPSKPAVLFEEQSLSYQELNDRATSLGKWLQWKGVGPGVLVGLCVERSLDMVVGLLGILKTGGAYVPLGPNYPEDRLTYMAEDSGVQLILTQERLMSNVTTWAGEQAQVVALDRDWDIIVSDLQGRAALRQDVRPDDLAYLMYTSGSTGRPKGVMIPHRALTNFLVSMGDQPGLDSTDKLLAVTTYCFDISGLELYLPLLKGGQCFICSEEVTRDGKRLLQEIRRIKPSVMQATPATWSMLFHAGWDNKERLKVLCGGEALPETLRRKFVAANCDVWNMYGPTETTIWSTLLHLEADGHVNIGKPIANTQIYIVDRKLRPVPVGAPGELCIAGDGLAKGYWNRPDITAEKFIANPFPGNSKLYRTGDLARWRADGTIDYLGRTDHQVKIRGFRIELGEIEARLNHHPAIRDGVVVVKTHDETQHLVCYYMATVSEELEPQSLRKHLKEHLPDYMVPHLFVHLQALPLTPNGKTDRKALMERELVLSRSETLPPPETPLERRIWSIWKDVLHISNIGLDDGFFDIGGTSVSATALVERINQTFGCDMTLATLVSHTTITALSRYISSIVREGESQSLPIARQDETRPNPNDEDAADAIAIVGMAGKFPGADDLETFWENVEQGRNCIIEVPETRWSWKDHYGDPVKERGKTRIKWGGFIGGIDEFDPLFFGIAPREAELMDPQQRLLMTYSWLALEHAGIAPSSLSQKTTGVFIAASAGEYRDCIAVDAEDSIYGITSESTAMIPSRISYTFNLHGPSELCETTCSSSLVAIHRAIQSMRAGECEQAIVGGVNLLLSPKGFSRYEAMGLLSTQNEVKSFQVGASGYLRAEGVGVVVLKPLSKALADGDIVYALLKGSGVSHGGRGMSLTSPNGEGMKSAMIRAYTAADVDPRTVGYIETHGIASPVGDSIEINALKSGYRNVADRYPTGTDATPACYLSCLKPTMGHGEIVSGMAALIKAALALRHQVIPSLARFTRLHQGLSLAGSPFQISRHSQSWGVRYDDAGKAIPRRASINSYGFGASAHLVLEEYPSVPDEVASSAGLASAEIIILSAKTKDQLKQMAKNLRAFLLAHPQIGLRDLAYTLQVGREAMRERLAILANDADELMQGLACFAEASNSPNVLSGMVHDNIANRRALATDLVGAWSNRNLGEVARAWIDGVEVPWARLERDGKAGKVVLPAYPFERKAYWAGRETPPAVGVSAPMKKASAKKRICVVGAGPAGLVMAKSLLEEGHEPVVYEASDTFGGVWNLREHKNSGAYKSTRFQNSVDTSFFSDFPPNAEQGLFPGVEQVRAYLEAYADRFHLKRTIHFGSKVVAVTEAGESWRVEVKRGGEHQVDHFDGVALCHGRYHHPAVPAVEGLSDFRGEVLHSGQYYDNRVFEGKRVLVVGNGVSGMDIAEEASHVARATYWSMRSLKFVLPRMVGYLPNDFISPANLLISPDNSIIMERLKNSMPDYYAAYRKSGLFPGVEDFRANPFVHINDGVIQRVADGAIQTFVEDIARFTASGCIFKTSGTEVKDLDMVVMCTGYDDAKSFEHVKQFSMQDDFAMGLFYHRNPSLVNAYGIQNVGTTGTLPYLEMVARWYAQVISGHYQFSQQELEHRIDKRDIVVAPLSNVVIGLKLGLLPRPEQEFGAFWHCLNMPSFPPMYRLRGPHAAPEAQSILSRSIQRSFIPQDDQDPALQKVKYRLLAGLGDPSMRDLLERQEITADDYRQAQDYRSEPIVLSWDTQFIKPAHGETEAVEVHSIAGESNDSIAADAVFSDEVKRLLAKTLKLDPQEIGLEQNLSNYGFSSVTLTAFSQKITDEYGIRLAPSTFMEHATLKSLSAFMYQRLPAKETKRPAPSVPRREETDRSVKDDPMPISIPPVSDTQDIAIIGLGGKLPGARDLGEFWRNLLEDKSPITSIPEDRWSWKDYDGDPEQADKTDCHRGAFIDDVGDFDPLHFKLSPREAILLDPQHRLLLEAAWETLENAGYAKSALFGKKVGCFIGVERQDYANKIRSLGNPVDGYLNTGNSHAMLVNRVSHYFGWKGPTLAVDTACSSSFTALHAALRSLQNGDAELALAGGVNLVLAPDVFICSRKLGLFTGEDHIKPFDRNATGHFFSDGLGLVLLKPLASAERDGDHIYGVIKGLSVRHGGQGVMLTFPNPISHREVIEEALQQARLHPSDIDYIEGQGTANPVTDIVELKAYHQVFARQARPVPIGTIKGHVGHFAGASGVIALIKALLSLKNNQLIKVANFKALNWEPDDEPFSCEVLSEHQPWPSKWVQGRQVPRRIGVHNFGFGGVTGHLILEEHLSPDGGRLRSGGGEELIVLSARKADQLVPMAERLLHYLEAKEYRYFGLEALDLGDVAYTLQVGREPLTNRMALLARSLPDLIQKLRQVVNRANLPDDCWWGSSEEEAVSLDRAALRRADLRELAQFWLQGRVFDWGQLNSASRPKRVPLPTYPFSRARYWVQAPDAIAEPQSSQVKVASAAMPHEVRGMIPTLNGTGTMTKQLLACSESFVDYAGQCEGEVLDLGCAYGGASLSALERGARVFAVDMDPRHLEILTDRVRGEARSRIATQQGMLPALDLDENRFAAIHAGRVLHFLNPEALQETMAKLFRWLQPGGKLFVTCDTPYFPHWAAKLSDYEAAKAAGDLWPGYIANLESFFSERSGAGAGHAWDSGTHAVDALKGVGSINLIDPDILRRESIAAGFDVEKVGFEGLAVEVNGVRMAGGFEHVGLIAVKPFAAQRAAVPHAEKPPSVHEIADKTRSIQIQPDILSRTIKTMLAAELGIQEAEIEDETKFFDLGLNSAIGVSWMNRINETYGLPVPAAKLFSYPTLRTFSRYLLDEGKKQGLFNSAADVAVSRPLQKETPPPTPASTAKPSSRGKETDIAIIGMSCRFPQSRNKSEFWEAIRNKRDCIGEVPENRWSMADYYDGDHETPGKTNCRFMGALDDADCFDPMFFHISPLEARHMDPQQRLFLEEAWSCLEDAGYATDKISGSRCGVFVGYGNYGQDQMASAINAQRFIGASPSILAARIAYFLNLQGPCLTIDTACSASLVAVAQACNSLVLGDSDLALAGGVSVLTGPAIHIMASKAGMLSNDGRCFTLDQRANGFVPGEGVGVIALKRLADAQRDGDIIHGLVRGWGVNQDGSTNGITAPNQDAQIRLQRDVYDKFRIDPSGLQYVEMHGTGTKLGDPIEVDALVQSFQSYTDKQAFCALGSVKSNVGHTLAAAGIAGMIKMLMAFQHRQLPPTLHVGQVNEHINLANSPFLINTECKAWDVGAGEKRRAAVNSFGYSGTNAHVVLEAYDDLRPMNSDVAQGSYLIVLSARNKARLQMMVEQLLAYVTDHESLSLADLAYTLQTGRMAMEERIGLIVETRADLIETCKAVLAGRDAANIYRGQTKKHDDVLALFSEDEDIGTTVGLWMHKRRYSKLLALWVRGLKIDWHQLYDDLPGGKPRRISLPTYPFARERYWQNMPSSMASGDAVQKSASEEANRSAQPAGQQDRAISEPIAAVYPEHANFRYLTKQWEPASANPHPLVDKRIAILATEETQALARELLRIFPASEVLNPDDIHVSLKQSGLSSSGFAGCIDLIGCGRERHESLKWLEWLRRLVAEKSEEQRMLLCVSHGLETHGNSVVTLSGASRVGLYRMLQSEYSALQSRHMDADPDVSGHALAKQIAEEFSLRDQMAEVCYRNDQRYKAVLREVSPASGGGKPRFSGREVVWITGGTRGLGMLCAQHLVKRHGVKRLLLSGQEKWPPRHEWPDCIADNHPRARQMSEILTLAEQGVEVRVMSIPLTDETAVRESLAYVRRDMGPIGGLIHCAGMMDTETPAFIRKSVDGFRQVLSPKIAGLDLILSQVDVKSLRCVILFSSVAGIIPTLGAGQSDYAMANAYMDYVAYAYMNDCPMISIQWPHWEESEKGELKSAAYASTGLRSHTHREGLRLLDQILSSDMGPVVLPAAVNPDQWKPGQLMNRRIGHTEAETAHLRPAARDVSAMQAGPELSLEAVRTWLLALFCKELEIPAGTVQTDTDFHHYGVDSILLSQLTRTIGKALTQPMDPSVLFDHSTIDALAAWLMGTHEGSLRKILGVGNAVETSPEVEASSMAPDDKAANDGPAAARRSAPASRTDPAAEAQPTDIAIIGMSCRFPGAHDLPAYWRLLSEGRNAIARVPRERWGYASSFHAGLLDSVTRFDPDFFQIPETDARLMDPQALLVLEETLNLFSHAGYSMAEMRGTATGVYLGARSRIQDPDAIVRQAKSPIVVWGQNYMAANVSHFFDLRGPSLVIDTACSSALVAMHSAIDSLRSGENGFAVVGGVNLLTDDLPHRIFQQRNLLSPEPAFHIFDQRASGVVLGEGAGLVLLKTRAQAEKDGDTIYAVIKALAINNDGRTAGPTTPSIQAQKAVMQAALAKSGNAPGDISFIETNGSGSEVTDLLELKAIEAVYRSSGQTPCGLGSIKPNIGHPLCAEGIAGLIKLTLMLKHKQHVPFLSGTHSMTHYSIDGSPFFFHRTNELWFGMPRVAALSCFADGGTNAHLILEEWEASDVKTARRQPIVPPPLHRKDLRQQPLAIGTTGTDKNWWGTPLPETA